MTSTKLKMWIGNLDGRRQGLVIAASKTRARQILGVGVTEFDGYWSERPVDTQFDPEVLYTRRFNTEVWHRGRCSL